MKKSILFLLLIASTCFGQKQSISIDSCIIWAKKNYPLIKQNNLIEQNSENNIKGDNKNWLPKVSFISQATYQSEVSEFNLPGSHLTFPKDQYMNALNVEQTLFDAGQIKQQKLVEKLNAENELEKNEVELYKLIDRVNQLYSSILLTRENLKTLNIYLNDITNKKTIISASLKNGLVLQSNLDGLEAEELKTEQSIIEAKENINAIYQSLGQFINKTITDSTELSVQPIIPAKQGNEINRPELKMFSNQKDLIDARYKLTNKAAFPRIAVFGEGVYGRPGYNFLNQDMRFFGKAGINLKWNISALYNLSKEKQNASISKQMVDVQKEVFEFNLKTSMATQTASINSLKQILEKDKSIIEKRHHISLTAASQLENGSITTTDYLTELNAEMQAILNQKIHEIKLMNAITNYNTTKGITNF